MILFVNVLFSLFVSFFPAFLSWSIVPHSGIYPSLLWYVILFRSQFPALSSMTLSIFNFIQILERVGLAELFIQIEEKMENVVLPSYVDQTSHVSALNSANKGGPSTKELCSNTDKALKNFFASINVSIVQNVSSWRSLVSINYNYIHT